MIAYLAALALLGGQRLWELRRARRHWDAHRGAVHMENERCFRWMVVLHASLFILVPAEIWLGRPGFGGWLSWAALAVFALALGLRFWTLRTMGRSWHVRVVHGPDYPIVCHGPFRYIRHPNYLTVILELAAFPLIYHLYATALAIGLGNALVLRFRIRNEERVLFENPAWRERMGPKPRFFPRFFG